MYPTYLPKQIKRNSVKNPGKARIFLYLGNLYPIFMMMSFLESFLRLMRLSYSRFRSSFYHKSTSVRSKGKTTKIRVYDVGVGIPLLQVACFLYPEVRFRIFLILKCASDVANMMKKWS
jgi:hypothetical protein